MELTKPKDFNIPDVFFQLLTLLTESEADIISEWLDGDPDAVPELIATTHTIAWGKGKFVDDFGEGQDA